MSMKVVFSFVIGSSLGSFRRTSLLDGKLASRLNFVSALLTMFEP
jgi:hypothetical protein